MATQKPAIALSLKARGLTVTPAIPRTRQALSSLGQSIADLSVSICTQVLLLSWSAWLSVLLVILSCVFWANYQDGNMAAADGSIMIPIALLIYLPCLGVVCATASRRLSAQAQLETVQSHVVGVYALHASLGACGAPQLLAQLDDAISDTMLQLQGYLAQPRTISSHHFGSGLLKGEVLPANSRLLVLGADMGQRLRGVHNCIRRLMDTGAALLAHCSSGSSEGRQQVQQALALVQLLVPLTSSLQALLSVKDLRTPLLLRVMLRPAVVIIAPLLTSSFLAGAGLIGRPVTAAGQVFAIVVGCILQVLLMSVYSLGVMLEDPFDTGAAAATDTLSLTEFMHTLAYLTAPDLPPAPELAPTPTVDGSEVTISVKGHNPLYARPGPQAPGQLAGMRLSELQLSPEHSTLSAEGSGRIGTCLGDPVEGVQEPAGAAEGEGGVGRRGGRR